MDSAQYNISSRIKHFAFHSTCIFKAVRMWLNKKLTFQQLCKKVLFFLNGIKRTITL